MKSLTVFDPAAADNTGAGDSTPVPELIRFASDAEWLKRKGVAVERWNLVSDPMEFALNHRVSMFLKRHGAEDLPYILVNGAPVLYGRYPTRAELAGWFGVSLKPTPEDCAAAASPRKPQSVWVYHAAALRPSVIHETPGTESGTGLRFLDRAPKTLFFTGKGGSGKTSVAAAAAIALTREGKRVLLVSADPASSLSQIFEQPIGNTLCPIKSVPGLSAIEIDPRLAAFAHREQIVKPVRDLLPESAIASIIEELSGPYATEVAVFNEFTGLITSPAVASQYDHVLFDTAPTGHTLLVLKHLGAWCDYLELRVQNRPDLGPDSELERQRHQYQAAMQSLINPTKTRFVTVCRPHAASVREAARTVDELRDTGIVNQNLVLNGVLPESEAGTGPLATSIYEWESTVLKNLPAPLPALPRDILPLKPENLVGPENIRSLLRDDGEPAEDVEFDPPPPRPLADLVNEIAASGHGLIMMLGKGGVGKTTMAAAVAVRLAALGHKVHLSTCDPAAHIEETLSSTLPNLTVSKIDPAKETEEYRSYVMETQGARLDAAGRALLEEDLRSPCTEEIAVLSAISRVFSEAADQFVVMDNPPNGHSRVFLDLSESYRKEQEKKAGRTDAEAFRSPILFLQDPTLTKMIHVTVAETTPVAEARSLEESLRNVGIEPWAYIVNCSLSASSPVTPILRQRAAAEIPLIKEISERSPRLAIVPLVREEPVGFEKLRQLTEPSP